jgi:hypothetical protein
VQLIFWKGTFEKIINIGVDPLLSERKGVVGVGDKIILGKTIVEVDI